MTLYPRNLHQPVLQRPTALLALLIALAVLLSLPGPAAGQTLPGVPDVYLSMSEISLTERDDATNITVTATLREASDAAITVTLALDSAPLLTPGITSGATLGTDYTTTFGDSNRRVTIPAGSVTGQTRFAIDPLYDANTEGDEAIILTGNTYSGGGFASVVAPTDLIIEDGPYLSFPTYIDGSLHYPGEAVTVTVGEAINPSAAGSTVTYSLTRIEPSNNPLGLRFNPSTRQLTGTAPDAARVPAAGLTTRYTITAVDSAGRRATTMISVAVVNDVCSSTKTTWFHATNEPPTGLVEDCNVLLAARDTLLGTSSSFWLNWATDRQIEDWTGLTAFHNDKQIRSIEVRDRYLRGTIPPVLGHLAAPVDVVLGRDWRAPTGPQNKLTGAIPRELGLLSTMTVLALSGNDLSGPIPRELVSARRLHHLYLHGTKVSGSIPPEFADLPLLRNFNISGNPGVRGHIPWQLGKNVSSGSHPGLQVLNLSENSLTGTIPWQLGRFGKFQQLALGGNRLTGTIPWQLGNLGAEEASVSHRITYLYLNNNQLTGPIPPQLGNIVNLHTLSLSENGLTGLIPPQLGNLPKLRHLFLRDNQLRGGIPSQLGSLGQLRWLALYNNPLGGQIPSSLGNLSNLTHLLLDKNVLRGQIPASFGQLTNLQVLSLSCNDLDGSVPTALTTSQALTQLHIQGNPRLNRNVPERHGLTVTRILPCEADRPAPVSTPTPTIDAWSATLTVQDLGGGKLGCDNTHTDEAKRCSAWLTEDRFIIGTWRVYSVTAVYIQNNSIHFNLNRRSATLRDYLLSVDNYDLAFSYPNTHNSWGPWEPVNNVKRMPFRWSEGSRVKLNFNEKEVTDADHTAAPAGGAASPLRILSASRTSVREGDPAITITARLARNAESERVIGITHGSNHGLATVPTGLLATVTSACDPGNADKDYTLTPAAITIPAGQRTGTATLAVCDDTTEDSGEYIYLSPDWVPPEAYPASGSGVYQVEGLRITILNDETENEPQDETENEPQDEPQTVEVPGPVVGLQLSATTDSITATWKTPQDGGAPESYVVRLDPADGSNDQVKQPGAGTTSVTFGGLEAGARYEVSVRAENVAGSGEQVGATVTLPAPELEPMPEPTPEPRNNGNGECDGTLTLDDIVRAQADLRAGRITVEEFKAVQRCWDKQRGF